jgi:DNA-binding winged helix-turn-helix (wHTH) protein
LIDGSSGEGSDKSASGFVFKSEVNFCTGSLSRLLRSLHWNFSIRAELQLRGTLSGKETSAQPPVMSSQSGSFYAGDWLVVPELNRVERNGNVSHLEPKAMAVLVYLSREPGKVVSKEKLISSVWRDTFVTDDVLKVCICQLRKTFEDDCKKPQVIETIPRSGYRLLVPVRENHE